MTLLGVSPQGRQTVAALGFFDGVHLGHISLLQKTVFLAKERGLLPAVFTFDGAEPYKKQPLLITEDIKEKLFFDCGIETVFRFRFSEISDFTPEDFVRYVLREQMNAALVTVGDDFRFGKNASGDSRRLSAMIPACVLPPILYNGIPVSSSRIREAITGGDVTSAGAMLGRPYAFSGTVIHGKALGRKIGFPTLNTPLDSALICPRCGVYVSRVTIDGKAYDAVTNVGVRPSVENCKTPNAESHLLHANDDFYGKHITVELLEFLRPETKFSSVDALTAQIMQDKKEALQWITKSTQN